MSTLITTYTQAELARAKRAKLVTDNGVAYTTWLEGRHGAGFAILREPHHVDADILAARRQLRADQDVVTLTTRRPA